MLYNFIVLDEFLNVRIDKFLVEKLSDTTRNHIHKVISDFGVLVNDKKVTKNYKLRCNDKVTVEIREPQDVGIIAQDIPINVVYEDDDIIVINKEKGMVVHPACGHSDGTLVNAVMYHCKGRLSGINGDLRPGIVHRIDKNTSGLLVIAKNDYAHNFLSEQIKAYKMQREYNAVVYGAMKEYSGTINKPVGRSKNDRKKMSIDSAGRKAITHFEVIENYVDFSHLKLILETGRTHQIRVHMSSIHHPVVGDDIYGPKRVMKDLGGQCLHARTLGLVHPTTKKEMLFTTELPEYYINFLSKIRKEEY